MAPRLTWNMFARQSDVHEECADRAGLKSAMDVWAKNPEAEQPMLRAIAKYVDCVKRSGNIKDPTTSKQVAAITQLVKALKKEQEAGNDGPDGPKKRISDIGKLSWKTFSEMMSPDENCAKRANLKQILTAYPDDQDHAKVMSSLDAYKTCLTRNKGWNKDGKNEKATVAALDTLIALAHKATKGGSKDKDEKSDKKTDKKTDFDKISKHMRDSLKIDPKSPCAKNSKIYESLKSHDTGKIFKSFKDLEACLKKEKDTNKKVFDYIKAALAEFK